MGSLLRDIILTYVVALSVSMDAPVSRRLKAKRLGEGGTQTFDDDKYNIINLGLQEVILLIFGYHTTQFPLNPSISDDFAFPEQ